MKQRNIFGAMAFAVWAALAAFILAPQAQADPDSMDSQYLALLERDGIASSSGAVTKIQLGHQICSYRMDGNSEASVVQLVYTYSHLDYSTSVAFVRDAEQVYCPGYLSGGGGSYA
jgi:Protein of unknown function (DUF732)